MTLYRVTDTHDDRELGVYDAASPEEATALAEEAICSAQGEPLATRCRRVWVRIDLELAVDGEPSDALQVVDNLRENGGLQDPLNAHHEEGGEPEVFLKVVGATCRADVLRMAANALREKS